MKTLISITILFFSPFLFAGGSSGGGGVRPEMNFIMPYENDLVQTLSNDGNIIRFKYKAFDLHHTEIHDININDISIEYLDAIKKSEKTGKWEPVSIVN